MQLSKAGDPGPDDVNDITFSVVERTTGPVEIGDDVGTRAVEKRIGSSASGERVVAAAAAEQVVAVSALERVVVGVTKNCIVEVRAADAGTPVKVSVPTEALPLAVPAARST